jgi:rod shape-determining protein MreD
MTLRVWRRLFVAGFVLVILQLCVLERLVVGGAHPDAFLLFSIAAGLVAGAQLGAVVGFVTGLVADLFVVTPFGVSSLTFVLVAFAVGLAGSLPSGRGPHAYQLVAALLASIGGTLVYAGLLALLGDPHMPHGQLVAVAAVVSIANTILVLPSVAVMGWIFAGGNASARETVPAGGSALR